MSIDKPEIDFPGGEPPADLEIKDIWEGDGAGGQGRATPSPSTTSAWPSAPARSSTPAGTAARRSSSSWASARSSRAGTRACRA